MNLVIMLVLSWMSCWVVEIFSLYTGSCTEAEDLHCRYALHISGPAIIKDSSTSASMRMLNI